MQSEISLLNHDDQAYPPSLREGAAERCPCLWCLGDIALLRHDLLGLFCSTRCPGDVILQAYAVARTLRDRGVPVIGGFHALMEQECLDLLLRGTQPVVWCPARGLPNPRRLPERKRDALKAGRLLILSAFGSKQKRMTAKLAEERNHLVVQMASRLLFLYAPPGSRTENLCGKALSQGKTAFALAGQHGENLIALGATPVTIQQVVGAAAGGRQAVEP